MITSVVPVFIYGAWLSILVNRKSTLLKMLPFFFFFLSLHPRSQTTGKKKKKKVEEAKKEEEELISPTEEVPDFYFGCSVYV